MGPSAVGGEEGGGGGGGTSDRAVAGSGGRVRFRVLTPHEMQQTPEGKFSVSVWRKNKQVRLLCGGRRACLACGRACGVYILAVSGSDICR